MVFNAVLYIVLVAAGCFCGILAADPKAKRKVARWLIAHAAGQEAAREARRAAIARVYQEGA